VLIQKVQVDAAICQHPVVLRWPPFCYALQRRRLLGLASSIQMHGTTLPSMLISYLRMARTITQIQLDAWITTGTLGAM